MHSATLSTSPVAWFKRDDRDDDAFGLTLRALAAAPAVPLEVLSPPLVPGASLDEFELLEVLGRGGMSVVYRARDTLLDREVAIKVLNAPWAGPSVPDALLEQEARATARLRHPHIVTIHRVGSRAGRLYLVLELLEGETLAAHLRRVAVGQDEAISIGLQLCEALAHAHAHGIVHRDVKPGNVFIETGGRVKVLDFGLSSPGKPEDEDEDAQTPWAGTPAYMAPEQWRCEPVDERSDVYAAGVVLHQLMGGSLPIQEAARAPRKRWPRSGSCPRRMAEIVDRATAPDRNDRFPDAGAMAAALRAALVARRRGRIGRWIAAVLAAALAVAIGVAVKRELVRPPPLPDLSGEWTTEPARRGGAVLRRIDGDRYIWEHKRSPVREDDDTYFNRGVLELRRDGDRVVLAGHLADVPGWCCSNVGLVELEVTSADELHMVVSMWGKTHSDYQTAHPPYWFRRVRRN